LLETQEFHSLRKQAIRGRLFHYTFVIYRRSVMAICSYVKLASAKSLFTVVLRSLLILSLLSIKPTSFASGQALTTPTFPTAIPAPTTLTTATPDEPITNIPPPPATTATELVTTVSIFYINVRGEDNGLPYTMFHRDSGSIIGADDSATTFVVTATLSDQRTRPMATRTDNVTTNIPTLRRNTVSWHLNMTAKPSTITQGPSTFLFTGSGYGPNRTLVNRCRLNGTRSATCNLTHVGAGWYTHSPGGFDGTYRTTNYSWTSGDRFGFAPVTITAGVEKLPPATAAASSSSSSLGGLGRGVMLDEAVWAAWTTAVLGSLVFGVFLVL
jgi:hypothetical protein